MRFLLLGVCTVIMVFATGCTDQTSVISPEPVSQASVQKKASGGEILVDQKVHSMSTGNSYLVTGSIIYEYTLEGKSYNILTGVSLSFENMDPSKSEAFVITAASEYSAELSPVGDILFEKEYPAYDTPPVAYGPGVLGVGMDYKFSNGVLELSAIRLESLSIEHGE